MKRRVALAILVATSLAGIVPVHAKARHPAVSCKAVRDALAAGKSKEDVAAQMKTSTAIVARCQTDVGAIKPAKTTSSAK